MARTLRNLRIDEVSGVDRGANAGARIMVRKALDYDAIDAVARRRSAAVLLDTALAEMRKAHPHMRESDLFDKTLRDNSRAREWWQTVKGAPDPRNTVMKNVTAKPEREPDEPDADADERAKAAKEFNRLTDSIQRAHQCSRTAAQDMALRTDEGQAAWQRYRAAR